MRPGGVLCVALLALAGCATPVPTRHYTLSGAASPAKPARATPDYRVAIGPATVPEALDRPQIVLHVAPNRYAIADADRWSSPLKREIPQVIADEVGQRLPAAHVAVHFQHSGQDADYRVLIDVLHFESVPGDAATLEAEWTVRNRAGARLHEARSVFVETVRAPGVAPLVAAHGKALAALAREIAAAIETLARAPR